jgi:hypothetical protein
MRLITTPHRYEAQGSEPPRRVDMGDRSRRKGREEATRKEMVGIYTRRGLSTWPRLGLRTQIIEIRERSGGFVLSYCIILSSYNQFIVQLLTQYFSLTTNLPAYPFKIHRT